MASIAHCDTHVVLWLYAGETDRLSTTAIEAIESSELLVSPMVRLEVQFLREIKRIKEGPDTIFKALQSDFGIGVCTDTFESVIRYAETIHWTRDPFDRVITAQALLSKVPLITRDDTIRKNYKYCLW